MKSLYDKTLPNRMFLLLVLRLAIKICIIAAAFLLGANFLSLTILLFIVLLGELYKNVGTLIIRKGASVRLVGAFISALDGIILIAAIYYANALSSDIYLLVLLSIAINTAEYGLLSAVVEGIVAGFSYAILVFATVQYANASVLFSTYFLRICALVFFGWITGWLAAELSDKEGKLRIVLEQDIHEEELNEMKNSFVAEAAENIRTPISAIKGYTDILLHGRLGELDDRVKMYLDNIATNIGKVDVLADELLHIIQLEDDSSMKLRKHAMSVGAFIDAVKADAQAFTRIYHSQVTFAEQLGKDEYIEIDESRLKIAVKNILFYLFELTGNDVAVHFEKVANDLQIRIQASITKFDALMIFQEAEQLERKDLSTPPLLKVYTSKLIIESHDGSIKIGKRDDNTVTFTIIIPYKEKRA